VYLSSRLFPPFAQAGLDALLTFLNKVILMAIFSQRHSSGDENLPPSSARRSFFKSVSSRTLNLTPLRRSSASNTIRVSNDSLRSSAAGSVIDFELLDATYSIGAGFLSLSEARPANASIIEGASTTVSKADGPQDSVTERNTGKTKEVPQKPKVTTKRFSRIDS
jgi:hypothetical protein